MWLHGLTCTVTVTSFWTESVRLTLLLVGGLAEWLSLDDLLVTMLSGGQERGREGGGGEDVTDGGGEGGGAWLGQN